jgi:hypothetical protein
LREQFGGRLDRDFEGVLAELRMGDDSASGKFLREVVGATA